MVCDASIRFFHARFRRQPADAELKLIHFEQQDFPAPHGSVKCFGTVVARKPEVHHAH